MRHIAFTLASIFNSQIGPGIPNIIFEGCVIQKYIERPFLIENRKFDIRQWFLVTSWQPLELYIYNEGYCRFSKKEYDLNDFNKFIHLTNQAIQR